MKGSEIVLGKLLCGGVHAEGVVEGRVGCRWGLEEGRDSFVCVADNGERGGGSVYVGRKRAAGEVCIHVTACEGSVRVERDPARPGVVLFTIDEVAGFTGWGEHDLLFSLVGAGSFELVGCRWDEGWERRGGRGWVHWVVARAVMVRRYGWGEVAGEGALADGADALRLVADVLEGFGEAAAL